MAFLGEVSIEEHIRAAIKEAIKKIVEEVVSEAKGDLERRIREKAAAMTISIAQWAEVQTNGHQIMVTFRKE